jgi:hypothetical protein
MARLSTFIAVLCAATFLQYAPATGTPDTLPPADAALLQQFHDRINAGDADAMYTLATMQQYGTQVPLDLESARRLMIRAAAAKQPLAVHTLAMMYRAGIYGIDYQPGVAFEMLLEAANAGNPLAMYEVAMEKRNGVWLAKDVDGAKTLLAKTADVARPDADKGDIAAMVALANIYSLKDGPLSHSPARAGVLYLKAVNKGYLRIAPTLAILYFTHPEFGGEAAALKMMRTAAEAGDGHAQYLLGSIFAAGLFGVTRDATEGKRWLELSATRECSEAMGDLGFMYSSGQGVEKDPDAAMAWLERGIARNNPIAMRRLGITLLFDKTPKDQRRALDLLNKASELNDAPSLCTLSLIYHEGTLVPLDNKQAFACMKKAADMDDADALYRLSTYYYAGIGTIPDQEASFNAALRAATLMNPRGMVNVGLDYVAGIGTDKDRAKAKYWLDKAAAAGEPAGMYYDGQIYTDGVAVPKDLAKARSLFTASAQAGDPMAMRALGLCFASGLGGEQDIDRARKWMQRAADHGDGVAKAWLNQHPANAP